MEAPLLGWLLACDGGKVDGDGPPDGPPGVHSAVPSATGGSTATTGGGHTGLAPPPDCDPVVHVPGLLGAEDPTRTAEPHADVLGAAPDPFAVHLGWPASDPGRSVSVVWRTDVDTLATVLEYGPVGGATTRVEGASFRYGGAVGGPGDYRVHEVKVCGALAPDTTYQYRVGGEGAFTPSRRFSTPAADVDHVRVAFAGDSRGGYLQWSLILQGLSTTRPDFYVFAGDAVAVGSNQDEWDAWFQAGESILPEAVVLAAHGNHEFLATNWFAQMSLPNNELWYEVRYGTVHLVVLNDIATSEDLDLQAQYVRDVLGPSDAPWKVVMHHQSAYATCTRHGSNETLREKWVPAFEESGVDVVIGGHNHVWERSVPLLGGVETDPASGITYLVTGGAGAPLYPAFSPQPWNAVALAREHGGIVDFGPTEARFEVRDQTGTVIDTFALPAD